MTDEITIYGYSDDVVYIDGDYKNDFYSYGDCHIFFDNGLIVEVTYDGEWQFHVVEGGQSQSIENIASGTSLAEEEAGRDYTEVLKVKSDKISQATMVKGDFDIEVDA